MSGQCVHMLQAAECAMCQPETPAERRERQERDARCASSRERRLRAKREAAAIAPSQVGTEAEGQSEPVEVTIFCPVCAVPHIDEGEWATTRHHKTHQCQSCGHEWRPFPFATVGVPHPHPTPVGGLEPVAWARNDRVVVWWGAQYPVNWEPGDGFALYSSSTVSTLQAENERLRKEFRRAAASLAGAASAYRAYAGRSRTVGRGKADPFFTTRAADFDKAVERARQALRGQHD